MVGDRVAEALLAPGVEYNYGYTYSGHPVSCAVALENIRIIKAEGLVERVRNDTGPYLGERLRTLADHPLVGEVRSLGFIGAIELVRSKKPRRFFEPVGRVGAICRDHCMKLGLVLRATRDTMLLSPPLIWERRHVDEFVELARRAFDLTQADVTAM
jgi:putrescine aminotransferase